MMAAATKTPPRKPRTAKKTAVAEWGWRITWRGQTWTDQDLTAQHVAVLIILNGSDEWLNMSMDAAIAEARSGVVGGPMRLINMFSAMHSVDRSPEGTPEDEANRVLLETIAEVRQAKMVDLLGAVEFNRPD